MDWSEIEVWGIFALLSVHLSVRPSVCLSVYALVHTYASLCSCMFVYMPPWLALAGLELDELDDSNVTVSAF